MDDYEAAKRKAKKFYKTIGRVRCPALNDFVHFGRAGFDHLGWQGSNPRRKPEQLRRFAVLSYAPKILSKATAVSEYRETIKKSSTTKWHGAKTRLLAPARFWSFTGEIDGITIRVIVRQIGNAKKHFFSIFGDQISKTGR